MNFKTYLVVLFIIISCNSKNSKNFSLLKDAFVDWYHKNHITEKFDYDLSYFNVKSNLLNNDYIEDINRFDLELSQINKNDLRYNNRVDYEILIKIINQLHVLNINNKTLDFNINDVIVNVYNSLFYVINNSDRVDFEKIITLKTHLIDVIKYLDISKDRINSDYNNTILEEFNSNYSILLGYIDFIKIELSINDDNYIDLDNLFDLLIYNLNKYNNWANYDYNYSSNIEYLEDNVNSYSLYIDELFSNEDYNYDTSIAYLKNKRKTLKHEIFNESLKIYLNFNDEPIWVDSSDTLDVVKWVVNNKIKSNTFSKTDLIDNIDSNYKKIVNFYKGISSEEIDTTLSFIRLKEDHEIVTDYYYLNNNFIINENSYAYPLNDYYSVNLIFERIFSMHNIYGSLNSNYNELRTIKNDFYTLGLSLFLYDLFVNNINGDSTLNKIAFYLELLKNIEITILQDTYIDNFDEKTIISSLESNVFLSESESRNLFVHAFELKNFHMEQLLTYFHLLRLYEKDCLLSRNYSRGEFLDKIFNYGYVNYYTIK